MAAHNIGLYEMWKRPKSTLKVVLSRPKILWAPGSLLSLPAKRTKATGSKDTSVKVLGAKSYDGFRTTT